MEGLEDPLLESKTMVTGVDKGQHRKENKKKRVLKQSMQGSRGYWSHRRGEFSIPLPKPGPYYLQGVYVSRRFGTTLSCCRKVATVCNEGLPNNDRKALDFEPNGGGN